MTQTGSFHIYRMCWLYKGVSDWHFFFIIIYMSSWLFIISWMFELSKISWLCHLAHHAEESKITFEYWKDAVKHKLKEKQMNKHSNRAPAQWQTNAGKNPLYMYFSCLFLEIETELQPEYFCIMPSSHIPDALCLRGPSSGPLHSSLNNIILYNPSVGFSLLILVRLLKSSNIRRCQKKHGTDLPATLSKSRVASELHPTHQRWAGVSGNGGANKPVFQSFSNYRQKTGL